MRTLRFSSTLPRHIKEKFVLDPIKNQEDIWHEPDGTATIEYQKLVGENTMQIIQLH